MTLLRHGSRATLHLPSQKVEKETALSSSRGPATDLPSSQVRYLALHFTMTE